MDPKARRYILPGFETAMSDDDGPAGDVTKTALVDIGLDKDDVFGYCFDFGDDWWHQINVVEFAEGTVKGKVHRIIKRVPVGQSPPQYLDEDDDEMS